MSVYDRRGQRQIYERQRQIEKNAERRRKSKIKIVLITTVAVLALACAGYFGITQYVKFTGYTVKGTIEMMNADENTTVYAYKEGFLKCAGDGLTYFDKDGIIWNETFSMSQPLCAVCGEYIAVVDMKGTEVSLFAASGFVNKFSLTSVATDIEVSKYGTVAVLTSDGNSNYVELRDKEGQELINAKTVFSASGYITDIALSQDGSRMAAAFVSVNGAEINSKVVFYNFADESGKDNNFITGEFDQYASSIVTTVKFMNGEKAAAIADNAFTIYSASGKPQIVYEEKDLSWQVQTLILNNRYIGFIAEDDNVESAYKIKVYSLSGRTLLEQECDYSYDYADFAGESVVLYSDYNCDIINFAGTHKFSYSFDKKIEALKSSGGVSEFAYLSENETEIIRLK